MLELFREGILDLMGASSSQQYSILLALKQKGELSAVELVNEVEIVSKGTQKIMLERLYLFMHLLEKKGLVTLRSRGRAYYQLTQEGHKFVEMYARMNPN